MLSVLNQTYPNVEYIIIDGGSTDGTVDIIKKYADRLVYWVSEPDKGIYDAMNKGIKVATGEWINFMNAGDEFATKEIINDLLLYFNEDVSVLYGDSLMIFPWGGKIIKPWGRVEDLRHGMIFIHQSSFVKTKLMKSITFSSKYRICSDYRFFLLAYKGDNRFKYIDKTISVYDAEDGVSSQNKLLLIKEKKQIQKEVLGKSDSSNLAILRIYCGLLVKKVFPQSMLNKIRCWNINRIHRK